MENKNTWTSSWSIGTNVGATVSAVWIAVSVIVGELHAPFKNWLKAAFTHHWIGKGVIAVAIFLVVTLVMTTIARRFPRMNLATTLCLLVWAVVAGTAAIMGFYFYEDFVK